MNISSIAGKISEQSPFTLTMTCWGILTCVRVCIGILHWECFVVTLHRISVCNCSSTGVSMSSFKGCQTAGGVVRGAWALLKPFGDHNRSSCKAFGKSVTTKAHSVFGQAQGVLCLILCVMLRWQHGVFSQASIMVAL